MLEGIQRMKRRGVRLGLGTDLLGPHQERQCTEFELRRAVNTPLEILRSATSINAEILGESGNLGQIATGVYADVIVVDGDPLKDVSLLASNGAAVPTIVKGGKIWKNTL